MPNPNAIVSRVVRFEPPLDRAPSEVLRAAAGLSVELESGQVVRLDPADPRSAGFAQVLNGLSRQRHPVYVEVDPATRGITRLLIPYVSKIVGASKIDEGVNVQLELSHARHVLRHGMPDFDELEGKLREAMRAGIPVILVESDTHEIIDIREFAPGPEGPPSPFPKLGFPPRPPWYWWFRDWLYRLWLWWRGCISAAKAQSVFDAMNATSCDPLSVPVPCIPFLYPDDGCWARAHQMCRLMIGMGLKPAKVWIQGNLYVKTKNNPSCYVQWGWHVAPTLCVRGPTFFQRQSMVIDPSLFATPVSKPGWKAVQGDTNATLKDTDASDFLWGAVDPTYSQTEQTLAFYRLQLQNRAIQYGPPPYSNCP